MSTQRDLPLITRIVQRARAHAATSRLLVYVDGLASHVAAVRRVCRALLRTGRVGRPRPVQEARLLLGQMIKRYVQRGVACVERRSHGAPRRPSRPH